MERVVEPEWLDELPPEDVSARASRADLRRLNWLMGNARIFGRHLRQINPPIQLCDLGTGDATLLLRLARSLGWRDCRARVIDRQPVVLDATQSAFRELGWEFTIDAADVFEALRQPGVFDVITTNLFLHHFQRDKLSSLLGCIAKRCQVFIAVEPRRSAVSLTAARMIWAVGCGRVTRHDAVASVRAGFRNSELTSLWQNHQSGWRFIESRAGMFSHVFVARRN